MWVRGLSDDKSVDEALSEFKVRGPCRHCLSQDYWCTPIQSRILCTPQCTVALQRFPQWMWRNTQVADFMCWLRKHNLSLPKEDHRLRGVGFYGLVTLAFYQGWGNAGLDFHAFAGCLGFAGARLTASMLYEKRHFFAGCLLFECLNTSCCPVSGAAAPRSVSYGQAALLLL